jgi:hypothetical protein
VGGKALDWGICGVGVLPSDRRMKDAMEAQDCLYTLVVKHPDGSLEPRVIGSIVQYLFAPDDPEAVIEKLADEQTPQPDQHGWTFRHLQHQHASSVTKQCFGAHSPRGDRL